MGWEDALGKMHRAVTKPSTPQPCREDHSEVIPDPDKPREKPMRQDLETNLALVDDSHFAAWVYRETQDADEVDPDPHTEFPLPGTGGGSGGGNG